MYQCPKCARKNPTAGFCPSDGTALRPESEDPLIGTEIGSYRIESLLGVGGMGRVYKAVHPSIGSRVAVKVLSYECAQNADMVGRFIDEATAANRIRHENIINILDLNKLADGRPYIIMEYLDGAPFADIVEKQRALPLGGLARLTGEVLSALHAAHQQGIVHRDLKPDNIFISPQGRAKVLDFGIAKLKPELSGRTGPTRTGSLLGTPHYMAPEQAMAQAVDARTDIYAVGVILYEGATGQRPFQAASLFELLHKQVNENPAPPRSLRPDLPPDYEAVILRAMAKNPAHRFQSAGELAHALEQVGRQLPAYAWSAVVPGGGDSAAPAMPTPTPGPMTGPGSMPGAMPATPAHTPVPGAQAGYPVSTQTSGQMHPQTAHRVPKKRTGLWIAIAAIALAGIGGAVALVATQGDDDKPKTASSSGALGNFAGDDDDDGDIGNLGSALGQLGALGALGEANDEMMALQKEYEKLGDMEPAARTAAMEKLAKKQMELANRATEQALAGADSDTRKAILQAQKQANEVAAQARAAAAEIAAKAHILPGTYQPDGFNPKRFDVTDFIGEATAKAKAHYADAELVRIDANGVYPSGHADLSLAENYYVLYRFNSPSRAKPPADKLAGVKFEPNCKFYVWVNMTGVRPYAVDGWDCDEPALAPKCSLAEVWEHAIDKGAPKDNAVADISLYTASKRTRWSVRIGDVFSKFVKDSCN